MNRALALWCFNVGSITGLVWWVVLPCSGNRHMHEIKILWTCNRSGTWMIGV